MEFNTTLFKEAGLNKNDIAVLFGVSRTTVHNWHNGTKVHALIQKKVRMISEAVKKALENHEFPVSERNKDERAKQLNALVKSYL